MEQVKRKYLFEVSAGLDESMVASSQDAVSQQKVNGSFFKKSILSTALMLSMALPVQAETLRWLTQTQPNNSQYPVEMAGIDAVNTNGISVIRSEFQVLGVNLSDALRLVSSGTFQLATTQIGSVAKDDPFLEGIDLIGVSTNMEELKVAVDAYREAFNNRLSERFGVKAVAIWPFGPQVFLCNEPIKTLDDMKGLKIRSFTASMSTLLEEMGATPVTLSFPEVYPALQRGVASCGVTSPTSSNTGKWPEVTTHLYPLSVSGAVQAHIVNLDWLNGLSGPMRDEFESAMASMEAELWSLADSTNGTAQACSTGGDCENNELYTGYSMTLVPVSEADKQTVADIALSKILPEWASRCEVTYPGCTSVWNDTIGAARGLTIE